MVPLELVVQVLAYIIRQVQLVTLVRPEQRTVMILVATEEIRFTEGLIPALSHN
jgi:hypothetical protein